MILSSYWTTGVYFCREMSICTHGWGSIKNDVKRQGRIVQIDYTEYILRESSRWAVEEIFVALYQRGLFLSQISRYRSMMGCELR